MEDEFTFLLRAGTFGSLTACVLCTPLDVTRHTMQAAFAKDKVIPKLRPTLTHLGVGQQLWRGFPAAIGHAAFSPAAFVLTYYIRKNQREEAISAGVFARTVQTVLVQPFDFVRTRRQGVGMLSKEEAAKLEFSLIEVAKADRSFRSIWRGLIPTLLRDVSASYLFWTSFIHLQRLVNPPRARGLDVDEARPPSALFSAFMGATCGVGASVLTQPFDIIKTSMQVHQLVKSEESGYKRTRVARVTATASHIFNVGGWRAFFLGGAPRVVRAAVCGLWLGPLFEFGALITSDYEKPIQFVLDLPPDPNLTVVHPRSTKRTYIEFSGFDKEKEEPPM